MLQAETKASGDTRYKQNYCIPAKSFAADQIGPAAKLFIGLHRTSSHLDHSNRLKLFVHQCIVCVMNQISKSKDDSVGSTECQLVCQYHHK